MGNQSSIVEIVRGFNQQLGDSEIVAPLMGFYLNTVEWYRTSGVSDISQASQLATQETIEVLSKFHQALGNTQITQGQSQQSNVRRPFAG